MAATDTSGSGAVLRHIVRVNEEIKSVVTRAFRINLMAMNAIFLAKRAGQAALGFGVLSNELRRFADDLQKQMEAVRKMTHSSVTTITSLLRREQVSRLFAQTCRDLREQGHNDALAMSCSLGRSGGVDNRQQMAAVNRRLNQLIADTIQLVELGSVLARSAKIEAAYGAGFSGPLTQVASDFEQVITDIQASLAGLTKTQFQEAAQ